MVRVALLALVFGWISAMVSATELTFISEALTSPVGLNPTHYGDPMKGCRIDEMAIKIQGVRGGICTPHCSPLGACPMDKPDSEAIPRCALENRSTGERFCALMCAPGASCGEGASCKVIQGNIGICTYDDVAGSKNNLRGILED